MSALQLERLLRQRSIEADLTARHGSDEDLPRFGAGVEASGDVYQVAKEVEPEFSA